MKNMFIRPGLFALALVLASCAVGPDYKRPGTPVPAAFKEAPVPPSKDAVGLLQIRSAGSPGKEPS